MGMFTPTVCVDSDGVTFRYSRSWKDGSLYKDTVATRPTSVGGGCAQRVAEIRPRIFLLARASASFARA